MYCSIKKQRIRVLLCSCEAQKIFKTQEAQVQGGLVWRESPYPGDRLAQVWQNLQQEAYLAFLKARHCWKE